MPVEGRMGNEGQLICTEDITQPQKGGQSRQHTTISTHLTDNHQVKQASVDDEHSRTHPTQVPRTGKSIERKITAVAGAWRKDGMGR